MSTSFSAVRWRPHSMRAGSRLDSDLLRSWNLCEPVLVAPALLRAASTLMSTPGSFRKGRQASRKVSTRHARVRAPPMQNGLLIILKQSKFPGDFRISDTLLDTKPAPSKARWLNRQLISQPTSSLACKRYHARADNFRVAAGPVESRKTNSGSMTISGSPTPDFPLFDNNDSHMMWPIRSRGIWTVVRAG